MGFASLTESICERYYGSDYGSKSCFNSWGQHFGTNNSAKQVVVPNTTVIVDPPVDQRARARRIIAECWQYFSEQQGRLNLAPCGYWELHYRNVDTLHKILADVPSDSSTDSNAWESLTQIAARLRDFFQTNPVYGPLSPCVLERVVSTSREIRSRFVTVELELKQFHGYARNLPAEDTDEELRTALKQFVEIRERLEAEEKERKRYFERAEQAKEWGDQFLRLRARLAVRKLYRPAFKDLSRLDLNEHQEGFVEFDHDGEHRIQGASGSGKTVILIHRALRLALKNPAATVRVFTINRSLAELLRESIASITGGSKPPQNLVLHHINDLG